MIFRYGVKPKTRTILSTPQVALQAANPHFSPLGVAASVWARMLQVLSASLPISLVAIHLNAQPVVGQKWV
jgi:hypothetical protein